MAKVRVVVNRKGIVDLLKSTEVQAEVERRAERIAAAAGDGMIVETAIGRNRARATVITDTYAARRAEAKDRRLSSSIDAGR